MENKTKMWYSDIGSWKEFASLGDNFLRAQHGGSKFYDISRAVGINILAPSTVPGGFETNG